ncbi:MAG: N-succinylarginine dihydrolase [Sphingomonadales bacterium]|nr:N-succinylarginine dihydrolase [Sphingomonadales bacterium]
MTADEINFDGLIGPTHNYAGLSFGNVASAKNAMGTSNPREGALQGLQKMKTLADMGLVQGVLPPQDRPYLPMLKALGFTGTDEQIVASAHRDAPEILRNAMAASAMGTANAATVSPSSDTSDGKLHFTPANLVAMPHRSIEAPTTARVLKAIFADEARFQHHDPLPAHLYFGDEGAANHNRFANDYGDEGLELFVYGQRAFDGASEKPQKYPARQSYEASSAIARLHGLKAGRATYVQQNPAVIDAGAFHNDVVAVSNLNVFFYHEKAFADPAAMQKTLRETAPEIDFEFVEVAESDVPVADAITSYLFNSQLIGPRGDMTLILPEEARETASTANYVERLTAGNGPIRNAKFLDVRQSMRNGGGPACLRLRVVMNDDERQAIGARVLLDDALYGDLTAWVKTHYRDRLSPDDLGDPSLMRESFTALDELSKILKIGSVYSFQR